MGGGASPHLRSGRRLNRVGGRHGLPLHRLDPVLLVRRPLVVRLLRSVTAGAVDEWAQAATAASDHAVGAVVPAEETRKLSGAVGVEVALKRLQEFVHDIRRPRVSVLPGGGDGIVEGILRRLRSTVHLLHRVVMLAVVPVLPVVLKVVVVVVAVS